MQKILVILGSTRPGRSGEAVANWLMENAQHEELEFELADLAQINLPMLDESIPASAGKYEHKHTKDWANVVGSADGYILVTAEYNHGYPAPMKNALDYLYAEWNKKPFAFVSYGGAGGVRAVQQLKEVVSELQGMPLPNQVYVPMVWNAIKDGKLDGDAVVGNLDGMLNSLAWWAKTLKSVK